MHGGQEADCEAAMGDQEMNEMGIGQRLVLEKPMSIIFELGYLTSVSTFDFFPLLVRTC